MSGQKAQAQLREERLAAELRANLKKRKARARSLKADSEAPSGSAVAPTDGTDESGH